MIKGFLDIVAMLIVIAFAISIIGYVGFVVWVLIKDGLYLETFILSLIIPIIWAIHRSFGDAIR